MVMAFGNGLSQPIAVMHLISTEEYCDYQPRLYTRDFHNARTKFGGAAKTDWRHSFPDN
jgi:hypothetical protein